MGRIGPVLQVNHQYHLRWQGNYLLIVIVIRGHLEDEDALGLPAVDLSAKLKWVTTNRDRDVYNKSIL